MKLDESKSFLLAKQYLGKEVDIVVDRPLGSRHPKMGFEYKVNYGFVPGTQVSDNAELDAYYIGVDKPVKKAHGLCIAIIHRSDDDDDKLVVASEGKNFTDTEIMNMVLFQEKWFKSKIIRK